MPESRTIRACCSVMKIQAATFIRTKDVAIKGTRRERTSERWEFTSLSSSAIRRIKYLPVPNSVKRANTHVYVAAKKNSPMSDLSRCRASMAATTNPSSLVNSCEDNASIRSDLIFFKFMRNVYKPVISYQWALGETHGRFAYSLLIIDY